MSINSQILLDTMRIAQEKQRICDAINSKSDVPLELNPMSGYAPAIEALNVVRDVESMLLEVNTSLKAISSSRKTMLGDVS